MTRGARRLSWRRPAVEPCTGYSDYRPIACCNILYKCISKVLSNRIKAGLDSIVSENQSAFIPGRKISDNILLTQEIMLNYHRQIGPPRCAFKVDIQKAYDTVDWSFLRKILVGFGFHQTMVEWLMVCVTSPSYSICINGDTHGYFKGKKGLRQGDPLSPYLFTLVMEILTLHLHSLAAFSEMSGLFPSASKSSVFFCNVPSDTKSAILTMTTFNEGHLPVRYLGVPLISSRLRHQDCMILVEKMEGKINSWMNKSLSFAGRVQLIISVLSALHVYWSTVFILPTSIINHLEAKMRKFLWCQGPMRAGGAKVAWKAVCKPKNEGGLVNNRSRCSWSWRKILNLRDTIRPFIWNDIGDGRLTSAWFDWWALEEPLCKKITPRMIHQAGFNLSSTVATIYEAGLPIEWTEKWPELSNIGPNNDRLDQIRWKSANDVTDFSSSRVWESIRNRSDTVSWNNHVWFPHAIPRHAFIMWLAIKGKLLTQDRILNWSSRQNYDVLACPLCLRSYDSRDHLFFECAYSRAVWLGIRDRAGMQNTPPYWSYVIADLGPGKPSKSIKVIVARLVVSAATYFIWQERNGRLFKNQTRPPDLLCNIIVDTIRHKLLGLKLKRNNRVMGCMAAWGIEAGCMSARDITT
ncbi:hypothetical protein SSX86_007545 [Deinandra increscens subsp. villosa]|uniref:Reverse transcriptase domain-containing protein n=1 Tax=Deinandra increscens subsp. villosa TaxID=3103831 RepID=A0AAP0DEW8_9ASTR